MLADELLWMLKKGFTLQYRQPSMDSRPSIKLYEAPIPRSRTFRQKEPAEQDLWGGARNAELAAWGKEA